MKTRFTPHAVRYLAMTCVLAYLSLTLNGQTTYNVGVSNFAFTPTQITITAGDKVVWTNNGGSHNVNGTKTTFVSNPESFGNNVSTGWTYEHVFNTAGTYNYQCDPHAGIGMTGKITVNPKTVTSSQALADGTEKLLLYPNPANQYIQVQVPGNYEPIRSVKIYTVGGSIVDEKAFPTNKEQLLYDISQFKNGMYFIEISAGNQRNVLKFIKL
jgi:plastocyanin